MNEQPKYSGGCLCGAIRYTCAADPVFAGNCHCRDCQRSSGSAFVPAMLFPKSAVRITGTPTFFARKGDSGRVMERGFCPQCGSQLFARLEALPDALGIRAGTLDDASRYSPAMNFFVASAQPWDEMNPTLPKIARAPGG